MTIVQAASHIRRLRELGVQFVLHHTGFHAIAPTLDLHAEIEPVWRDIEAFLRLEAFGYGRGFCIECCQPALLDTAAPAPGASELGHVLCRECADGAAPMTRLLTMATRQTGTPFWASAN